MAGELVVGPGLIQWGTLLLGRNQAAGVSTAYRWKVVDGWQKTPGQDSGTVNRAQQHGGWPGRYLAQPRVITLKNLVVRTGQGRMGAAIAALEAALPIGQDTEQPLVIQLDERGPLLVNARVLAVDIPVASTWQLGWADGGQVMWECTDPRRYDLTEQVAITPLPASESGLNWGSPETGLNWGSPSETGLNWGTPGSTGNVTCTNAGRAETHPIIQITGPCTTPSITLVGTNTVLEYGLTLGAGDVLVIDCWNGTVTLGGQDRLPFVTARSVPEASMVLPPGATSVLAFRSADLVADPAATATVRWRSAYW